MALTYNNEPSDAAETETFMSPVTAAMGSSRELAARLSKLADRLCGSVPPTVTTGSASTKLASVPVGVFEEVADKGRQTINALADAFDALNRIERALP